MTNTDLNLGDDNPPGLLVKSLIVPVRIEVGQLGGESDSRHENIMTRHLTSDISPVVLPQPHGVVNSEPRLLVAPAVPGLEALPVLGVLDALLDLALLLHVVSLVLGQ